mmetsp:Transcript_20434/g.68605  ORF Transcript_20434/g.68605 Transcript_20434/m.68605 type:complete len:210 (+) Transcript_20434:161-790(+)
MAFAFVTSLTVGFSAHHAMAFRWSGHRCRSALSAMAADAANTGHSPAWYEQGLNFSCTKCGNCCTGPTGFVWFSEAEGHAMAARLGLSHEAFLDKYARRVRTRGLLKTWRAWALKEVPSDRGLSCVLLDKNGHCSVYTDRPKQCTTYPIWPEHIESREAWAALAEDCPGAAKGTGDRYLPERIAAVLAEMDAYWATIEAEEERRRHGPG